MLLETTDRILIEANPDNKIGGLDLTARMLLVGRASAATICRERLRMTARERLKTVKQ
jgi:hypothetical protein